jgi:hypothetical protein
MLAAQAESKTAVKRNRADSVSQSFKSYKIILSDLPYLTVIYTLLCKMAFH